MNKILKWILIGFAGLIVLIGGLFVYGMLTAGTAELRKPAIYLYPVSDSFVNVQLDVNGKITKDIPAYNNRWNVFATKEGIIDGKYDYLFYEAKLNEIQLPLEGWVVKYSDLENWFDINLIKMGLNQKESEQFKDYWLSELPKANYYEIKLFEQSFLKENMNVIINPQPDTFIRLNFYFRPLKNEITISEPQIITPQRDGFVAVEWGGALDN